MVGCNLNASLALTIFKGLASFPSPTTTSSITTPLESFFFNFCKDNKQEQQCLHRPFYNFLTSVSDAYKMINQGKVAYSFVSFHVEMEA